ncbi:MAG: hypothetical protein K1X64_11605 [Myxococcaceae bacterium]|nr:hypothetical protein [Myxococcaceae bacterium]
MKAFWLSLCLLAPPSAWAQLAALEEPTLPASDDTYAPRIIGSFLGGAVSLGLPLLTGYLLDRDDCRPGRSCSELGVSLGASVGVGLLGFGAWFPYSQWGGKAGPGFGLAGALAGYSAGLLLLGAFSAAIQAPWAQALPAQGVGLLLTGAVVGATLGLRLRDAVLDRGAVPWSAGRLLATTGALLGTSATFVIGLAYLFDALSRSREPLALVGSALVLVPLAVTLSIVATMGVHRAMGGKGRWWTVLTGLAAGFGAAAIFVGINALSPVSSTVSRGLANNATSFLIGGIAAAIWAAFPIVALEWSSALNSRPSLSPIPPPPPQPGDGYQREEARVEIFPAGLGVVGRF